MTSGVFFCLFMAFYVDAEDPTDKQFKGTNARDGSIFDWVHFFSVIISRSLIVAVKYGYFSVEYFDLLRSHRLCNEITSFTQMF